ncbi:MAG: hypothetical protein Kow0092_37860 [Deferrisomatales bacterium]
MRPMILHIALLGAFWALCRATGEGAAPPSEPIQGAFGIALGQPLDLSRATAAGELEDGRVYARFVPDAPLAPFTFYAALVTPESLRVYTVWAQARIRDPDVCEAEVERLAARLEARYGPRDPQGPHARPAAVTITRGGRWAVVACDFDYPHSRLNLFVTDELTRFLAEKERLHIEGPPRGPPP